MNPTNCSSLPTPAPLPPPRGTQRGDGARVDATRIRRVPATLPAVVAVVAAVAGMAMLWGGLSAPLYADEAMQRTNDAAARLLIRSGQVQRDQGHARLLEALRHLGDPALEPYFATLAAAREPSLRLHGILGRAELRTPEPGLALATLAEIDHPTLQVQLISAALDEGLLAMTDARELLGWADLDVGVKLLVALQLLQRDQLELDQPDVQTLLHEALDAPRTARRGLAALMLHQLGAAAGTEALSRLNSDPGAQRDPVRMMLVQAAMRHELHRAGNWGYAIVTEPEVNPQLRLAALRLALRFGDPRAIAFWQEQFESTHDAAERNRLGLTVLELAPWLEPGVFEAMEQATDDAPLIAMARAGRAVAEASADVTEAVIKLIQANHPMANAWALRYAHHHAAPEDGRLILLGLILAYERGPDHGRARRLDDAVQAARLLYERDPEAARDLLHPILADHRTDTMLRRGILLGLVHTQAPGPHRVIDGIASFNDTRSDHLALLLRARADVPLTDRQMRELGLLVRGGGELQDSLRIQAAWVWLKRMGQAEEALSRVMEQVR